MSDSYQENVYPYTNNIPQKDGGAHLAGFQGALTLTLNQYIEDSGIYSKNQVSTTGDDALAGLIAVLSVKAADPTLSSHTKDKIARSQNTQD